MVIGAAVMFDPGGTVTDTLGMRSELTTAPRGSTDSFCWWTRLKTAK